MYIYIYILPRTNSDRDPQIDLWKTRFLYTPWFSGSMLVYREKSCQVPSHRIDGQVETNMPDAPVGVLRLFFCFSASSQHGGQTSPPRPARSCCFHPHGLPHQEQQDTTRISFDLFFGHCKPHFKPRSIPTKHVKRSPSHPPPVHDPVLGVVLFQATSSIHGDPGGVPLMFDVFFWSHYPRHDLFGTVIYAAPLTPLAPLQLIGRYGSFEDPGWQVYHLQRGKAESTLPYSGKASCFS